MLPSEYLEKGWTQGAFARDSNGKTVGTTSEDAVAWCMFGAILASQNNAGYVDPKRELYNHIKNIIGYDGDYGFCFSSYNDAPNRTHEEVIAVMKQAEQEMGWNNVA